jgi:hypothetical protein
MLTYEAWPGTLGPVEGTRPRRRPSIRRTTSIDSLWPGEVGGDLTLLGRARDLLTAADGTATALDVVRIEVRTEGMSKRIAEMTSEPALAGADALVGASAVAGLRKALATHFGHLAGTAVGLVLDDLPGAGLVSGSAGIRGDILRNGIRPMPNLHPPGPAVCAGRVHGGGADRSAEAGNPLLGQGPPAPSLLVADDPLAWHELPPLPAESMRRHRRIDVARDGDVILVDTHFRDSYMEPDGFESAVHEYEVLATLDADEVIRTIEVRPRVLPNPDCPGAVASAQRLVGMPIGAVRDHVRAEFRGETTCTHLNDQLRALADVPFLLAQLPQ